MVFPGNLITAYQTCALIKGINLSLRSYSEEARSPVPRALNTDH